MRVATLVISLIGVLAWCRILYMSRKNDEPLYKVLYKLLALLWSLSLTAAIAGGIISNSNTVNMTLVVVQGVLFLLIICGMEITRKKCTSG